MSSSDNKEAEVLLADEIEENFIIVEIAGCFWVQTKPKSRLPYLNVPMESFKFCCWTKSHGQKMGLQVDDQVIRRSHEYVIGRSVDSWCQSNEMTSAIEEHAVVSVIVSWFDDWCRKQEEHGREKIYRGRFRTFYDDLSAFTARSSKKIQGQFPRSSNVLSRKIKELNPILISSGVEVLLPKRDNQGRRVVVSVAGEALSLIHI